MEYTWGVLLTLVQVALPLIHSLDLDSEQRRQVVVDREPGQYLGHPTTVLLEDGKTILCVYPKGHGKGPIVLKRSSDGGRSWSERLPTPTSWETSLETPTIHRMVDPRGAKRLVVFSGLYPARTSVSADDGRTWTELAPIGDWGGIVVMGSVIALKPRGTYAAYFHDDGRFYHSRPERTNPTTFTVYESITTDGGLKWSFPRPVLSSTTLHLCEPGVIRSPDGKRLAMLLRENRRIANSCITFSDDEGRTWTAPRQLPDTLAGDRHVAKYGPDGRLLISFRDLPPSNRTSPTQGDWVAWVGTWEDLQQSRPGQYRVRLKDNVDSWDCAYPGVEVLKDGTFVITTYGHWEKGEEPYILSVRLKLSEFDAKARL